MSNLMRYREIVAFLYAFWLRVYLETEIDGAECWEHWPRSERMLDALHRGEASVQRGLSEKVNFEVVLLKASEESRSRAIDSLIKQVSASSGSSGEVAKVEKKKL